LQQRCCQEDVMGRQHVPRPWLTLQAPHTHTTQQMLLHKVSHQSSAS
jgi:hypothetical protein